MKSRNTQVDNTRRGFTLIELLVVIVIMTILTGISAGVFTGANQRLEVQKAANDLLIMAQYARMSAVEQQRVYKLYLDRTNNEFFLATTVVDEENQNAEEVVLDDSFCSPVVLDKGITIKDVRIISNSYNTGSEEKNMFSISFAPDGTSQAAIVQIGDEKSDYSLSVNEITGKSKLFPGTVNDVKIDTIDIDAEYY
ncbi:MAG: prepilin-type N-terminal cleavage/methylation domain-containing protein [Sedimentisphaerales bacterium]